jgi:hypothetical protein
VKSSSFLNDFATTGKLSLTVAIAKQVFEVKAMSTTHEELTKTKG